MPGRRGRALQYRRLRRGLSRRSAGTTGARWVSGHPGVGPPRAGRPEGYQTVSGTARPSRFAVGYAEPGRPRAGPVDRRSADTRRSHPTPDTARGQARNPSSRAYADPCAASCRSSKCLTLLLAHCPFPDGVGTCSAFNALEIAASDGPSPRSCTARAAEGGNGASGRPNRTPRSRAAATPADTSGRRISDSPVRGQRKF